MALKDVGIGFGTIPGTHSSWHCSSCFAESPVEDWIVCIKRVNGHDLDARQCPRCSFQAATLGCTDTMLVQKQKSDDEKLAASLKSLAEANAVVEELEASLPPTDPAPVDPAPSDNG